MQLNTTEEECRKLHTGTHVWYPSYNKMGLVLEYWYMRKGYINNTYRNVRQFIVLQNKLKIKYDRNLTKEQVEIQLKVAHKQRKILKQMAESLSLEYRTRLVQVKEDAGEIKAAIWLRNKNRIEG